MTLVALVPKICNATLYDDKGLNEEFVSCLFKIQICDKFILNKHKSTDFKYFFLPFVCLEDNEV